MVITVTNVTLGRTGCFYEFISLKTEKLSFNVTNSAELTSLVPLQI